MCTTVQTLFKGVQPCYLRPKRAQPLRALHPRGLRGNFVRADQPDDRPDQPYRRGQQVPRSGLRCGTGQSNHKNIYVAVYLRLEEEITDRAHFTYF